MLIATRLFCLLSLIASTISETNDSSKSIAHVREEIVAHHATSNDYPFMVQMAMMSLGHFISCCGTYIKPMYVLSASHCIDINGNNLALKPSTGTDMTTVRCTMGMDHLNEHVVKYEVGRSKNLLMHPSYFRNATMVANDIALIQLERPFNLSSGIQMIAMPNTEMDYTIEKARVMGFGFATITSIDRMLEKIMRNQTITDMDLEKERLSDEDQGMRLRTVTTRVLPTKECRKKSSSPTVICIGDMWKVPCTWDTGGPLIYKNMVIGVALLQTAKCSEDYGKYESVFAHIKWINSIVGNCLRCRRGSGGVAIEPLIFLIFTVVIMNGISSVG